VGISMKEDNSEKPTVLLNQYKNDGFLDFYYSKDLKEVMKVLDRIIKD
jgi:hypothetical protein